jgi:hypothetical protein
MIGSIVAFLSLSLRKATIDRWDGAGGHRGVANFTEAPARG